MNAGRRRRAARALSMAVALAFLGACGDSGTTGGGTTGNTGSTPPAPPANQPPAFSSATAVSVVENTGGTIYRAVAVDPEGGTVTYSISGGADAARFTIENGALRFVAAPNFDLPTDADEDNVYVVQISASDGTASSTLNLMVTVTNDKEGVQLHRIATGFDQPMGLVPIPGDTRFFVPERTGRIFLFDPATGAKTLYISLAVSTAGVGGLAGIAPMADYATSGAFVVLFSTSNGAFAAVIGNRNGTSDTGTLTAGVARSTFLPAGSTATGWIQLAPDGKVYFATSDALGATDPSSGTTSATSMFGKLFVVERNPDPYAGASPQFFLARRLATGLRFPRGGAFVDGRLILADRGMDMRQEVDSIDLAANGNFGWPYREGTVAVRTDAPTGLTDPIIEYRNGTGPGMGTGVVGGVVYRGPIASLTGHYVFADQRGEVFAVPATRLAGTQVTTATAIERRRADFAPDAGTLDQPTAVVQDAAGTVYILDADGEIFRIDPA